MDQKKAAIRQAMRERRRALSAGTVDEAGRSALALVREWPEFRRATTVLAYAAADNEVPTDPLIGEAWQQGKAVFLPSVQGEGLIFRRHLPGAPLSTGRFGIFEASGEPLDAALAGAMMIFVPLLAWDQAGGRIGRGRGCYDRFLAGFTPRAIRVGLGYEFQECARVPMDERDEPLDFVVSERRIVRCETDARSVRNRKDGSDEPYQRTHQPVRRHHSRLDT